MRKILSFFYTFLFVSTCLATEVTINVDIAGRSDYEVRYDAKTQARYEVFDELPSIISGTETLENDELSVSIKALTLSAVHVETISEVWDREAGTYTLVAQTSLDQDETLSLIDDVKSNLRLQSLLSEAFNEINALRGKLKDPGNKDDTEAKNTMSVDRRRNKELDPLIKHYPEVKLFELQSILIEEGVVDSSGKNRFQEELYGYLVDKFFPSLLSGYDITVKERKGSNRELKETVVTVYETERGKDAAYFMSMFTEMFEDYIDIEHICFANLGETRAFNISDFFHFKRRNRGRKLVSLVYKDLSEQDWKNFQQSKRVTIYPCHAM